MSKEIMMSRSGLRALEEELNDLKSNRRKEIAEKIKVAISYGDLSENSEYDSAKNEQAIIEARIAQLEKMLPLVRVLDESDITTDIAGIGRVVKVKDLDFEEEEAFAIVSASEADPSEGRISDESPVGKALIGKAVGDIVEVTVPSGAVIRYEILGIERHEASIN